jgi:MoaA/NifB/PqqE/SkfB family radical SAM enzyme
MRIIGAMSKAAQFIKSKHKGLDISSFFRLPYVFSYPSSASIEVSNLCNLKCPVCENSNISVRKKGNMGFENFKKIINELGPHLDDLELHNWGESFLNKDIYNMFGYVRKIAPRCYIYLDTNGHFMDVNRLFDCPPDELVFSIDGLDQATYERYRINGNLDVVIKNVKECVETKRKLLLDKPKIVAKFICMKHNEHQLESFLKFAREVGCDDYRIELFTSRTVKHAVEFMSTLPAYQKYDPEKLKNGKLAAYMKQLTTPCLVLWRHANIYWNGDVTPCCTDYDGIFVWGNIFKENNFWRVWNGRRARAFRYQHRCPTYRSNIAICKDCYLGNFTYDGNDVLELALKRSGRLYKK